ncbi:MAG: hypothetical protein Rhims3KO_36010 [Hyphomicrobiales bacterium]
MGTVLDVRTLFLPPPTHRKNIKKAAPVFGGDRISSASGIVTRLGGDGFADSVALGEVRA